ncbi:MAG: DNA modification methylase, partial [Nitrososphaeraceae archaeon]
IKEDGLFVPIILNQHGIILDGHHRYRACHELGIEPRTMEREFEDSLLEKQFVIEVNLKRRQLNEFQIAELGYKLEEVEGEKAKKRRIDLAGTRKNNKDNDCGDNTNTLYSFEYKVAKEDRTTVATGRVQKIIADKIGLSPTTYYRAKKIIEESPELIKDKVRSGKVTINKAYSQLQKEQKRKQFLLLANSESKISFPEGVKLILGDFVEYSKDIPSNSIDLIFTDPPYGEEYLHLYKSLFEVAHKVLKDDGGSLLTYCGHIALPRILRYVEEAGLRYWWTLCLKHSGASARVFGRYIIADWKPILFLVKGSKPNIAGDLIHDVIESKPPDKTLNDWAQSTVEAEYLISKLTVENQIVFDPMMGTGTTGIAALKLKRQFLGMEKDVETFEDAKRNISKNTSNTSTDNNNNESENL